MILRLQTFLTGLMALLLAALLALGSASANPTSGGYQLFDRAASGISADIQLASLGNFAPLPETASEYAIAPNTGAVPPRFVTDAGGNTIDLNFTQGLAQRTPADVNFQAGRGATTYDRFGEPNSYVNFGNGHAAVSVVE